jgi:hypothetical protein
MKTLSGTILVCAASILWSVALVVGEVYRPGAGTAGVFSTYLGAALVGCFGLFVIIAGLREENKKSP